MTLKINLRKSGIFKRNILALTIAAQSVVALSLMSPSSYADAQESKPDDKSKTKNAAVEEIVVTSRRESDYSIITERAQKILDVPGSLGDPLMAAFSLPGVLSKGEAGEPAIRGSSPSDNRYMVDGAPAGYVFHSFSTSIFNENIIQDFELYSAGFGAQYANAIGGVFDIKLRDPKHQAFTTKVDLGLLRSGIFLESEVSENSAFYFSSRRSMLQYFFDDATKKDIEKTDGIRVESPPQDTDYQFKYVYDLDAKNKLTLSANGATDSAEADFLTSSADVKEDPDLQGQAKLKNGFGNAVVNWRNSLDQGGNINLQVGRYTNDQNVLWGDKKYYLNFRTQDTYAIVSTELLVNHQHTVSGGIEAHANDYIYKTKMINYVCTETDPDCLFRRGDLITAKNKLPVKEGVVYANDHWKMGENFALDLGLQSHYDDLNKQNIINPRLAATWNFADQWTLTSSLGAYDRKPDFDKVFPEIGNPQLKSYRSDHFTLGLKENLDNGWSWSATFYYKTMDDLPLALDADTSPFYSNDVKGRAYGLDIFINKEITDRWYGWLAISTSKSLRTNKITNIEKNYFLDTPVVLNWVMSYKLSDKWTGGLRFTAQSGRAFTPIIGAQKNPYFDNGLLPVYGDAFSDHLPPYERLDLRFKRDMTLFGYHGTYNIDILNATNRQNVTDRKLNYKHSTSPQDYRLIDTVGQGIIPAVGMSVIF